MGGSAGVRQPRSIGGFGMQSKARVKHGALGEVVDGSNEDHKAWAGFSLFQCHN